MLRKKKKYVKPRQIYQSERIKEENALVKKYGLKNKREIWKTLAKVNYFRHRAKELSKAPLEEQEVFFGKLKAIGLKVEGIADVLDLKVEDLLERRLATIVHKKELAHSPSHARQRITHKKVLVNGKVVDSPSYLVPVTYEKSVKLKNASSKPKIKESEKKTEIEEGEEQND